MRALSIVSVLFVHFYIGSTGHHNWVADAYAHYGVGVFFVISGFLISSLLLAETRDVNLKSFYVRRAYRLFPVAYLYSAVMIALHWRELSGIQIGAILSYSSCYLTGLPWYLTHLWSLSCEEQFYFLWPFAVRLKKLAKPVAWTSVALGPVVRFWLSKHGMSNAALFWFPANADAIAAGCLLALYRDRIQFFGIERWRHFGGIWLATIVGPLFVNAASWHHLWPIPQIMGYLLPTILHAGVVICIQRWISRPPAILNTRPVVWVGTMSYSLYIWHMPFADPAAGLSWPVGLIFGFAVACASFYCVEQPILRFAQRRWKPRSLSCRPLKVVP